MNSVKVAYKITSDARIREFVFSPLPRMGLKKRELIRQTIIDSLLGKPDLDVRLHQQIDSRTGLPLTNEGLMKKFSIECIYFVLEPGAGEQLLNWHNANT